MKRGIEMRWEYDYNDLMVLRIEKKRGKLTLDEIEELLRYEDEQRYCGHYAILLNCSEATVDGGGLYLEEGQKGDVVPLYQSRMGKPARCAASTRRCEYCPSCGTAWKGMDQNVEKLIAAMGAEAERAIQSKNENQTQDGRLARYWSYIGTLDMAQQLGMITDKRRQEFYKEAEDLKKLADGKG